ncbi:MAG: ankyrin repeat domain-containing protein [Desulfobacterales bacterium]|nr:ankyrin repeat domain-containing protein [Desulfobacterales bacterium]
MAQEGKNLTSEIVKIAHDKGADVNSKDINGNSSLIIAAEAGNAELVKILLDYGASPMPVSKKELPH